MLPGPWLSDSYWNDEWLTPSDRARPRTGAVPLPRQAPWPRQMPLPLLSAVNALPVPGQSVFEFRDRPRLAARTVAALPSRRAEPAVSCRSHARHGATQTAGGNRRLPAGVGGENPRSGGPASASHPAGPPAGMRRSPAGER